MNGRWPRYGAPAEAGNGICVGDSDQPEGLPPPGGVDSDGRRRSLGEAASLTGRDPGDPASDSEQNLEPGESGGSLKCPLCCILKAVATRTSAPGLDRARLGCTVPGTVTVNATVRVSTSGRQS